MDWIISGVSHRVPLPGFSADHFMQPGFAITFFFLPISSSHNLANSLFFHNWTKGYVWTTFPKFKVDMSKRDWQNVQNWQQPTSYTPNPPQHSGVFRTCIQCGHGGASLFGDVSWCDWPEAAQGAWSGLMLDRGSPDCLSWAPPSVFAPQAWKGCWKHGVLSQNNVIAESSS